MRAIDSAFSFQVRESRRRIPADGPGLNSGRENAAPPICAPAFDGSPTGAGRPVLRDSRWFAA